MNEKTLALDTIRLDGGTQCRATLDADYIATLAEAWTEGAKIPAVIVFHDGSNYWLADGFHRYHAAQKCEFRDILAEVRSGTRLDAVKFALGANAAHGLRRTNADKRRAVEIALKEFPKLSSREISNVCAVSHVFVEKMRPKDVETVSTPNVRTDSLGRQQPAHKPARPSTITLERAPVEAPKLKDAGGAEEHVPVPAATKRRSEPFTMPDRGLFIARGAINQLETILPNDGEREQALRTVIRWCEQQLKTAKANAA